MKRIVIIGNGISGVTCARHIRKIEHNTEITIISSETKYFFSRTALMYIYMGQMRFEDTQPYEPNFWKKNRLNLIHDTVVSVDFSHKEVKLNSKKSICYDSLVLALGSKPNMGYWEGVNSKGVQGLYSYQDLELLEDITKKCKNAIITGGGLIGVELAEMLISRNIKVTFIVKDALFWKSVLPETDAKLVSNHILKHDINLRFSEQILKINSDSKGHIKSVLTNKNEELECDFLGVTIGVIPNVSFLKNTDLNIEKGILVDKFLKTNISDVYAIGDCAQLSEISEGRKNIEPVWYTARKMGEVVAQTICGVPTVYEQGIWFNSAKFFDLEFQTYGNVKSQLQENEQEFIWKNEKDEILLHFVFSKHDDRLIGINSFNYRLRHEIIHDWIQSGKTIGFVIRNFRNANFNMEFNKKHENQIIKAFIEQFNDKSE